MLKSLCIKTNNLTDINYILEELETSHLDNICYSCKRFKNFTNIIIHYNGTAFSSFITSISEILTYLVLDLYENYLIKKLISLDYFYFSLDEQETIINLCINNLNFEDSYSRFELIQNAFINYFTDDKKLNISGFIYFRLFEYIK